MATQQATCQERIDVHLESRIETLRDLWELYQEDYEAYHDEHGTNMYEFGLCFDYVEPDTFENQPHGYYRYQLSWGGPSDEFRFFVDDRGKPWNIEYWFLDWFDGAMRHPRGADLELMEEIFGWFYEVVEHA